MKWKVFIIMGLIVSLAGTCAAITFVDDSYETVPGTTDGTGDFDPNVPTHPYDLGINEFNETDIQVWNDPAGAHGGTGNNQYLNIRDGGSGYELWLDPPTGDMTVDFWLYNSGQTGLQFQIGNRISEGTNVSGLNLYWIRNEVKYLNKFNSKITVATFTTGQWHHVQVQLHWATKTWDLLIDAAPVVSGETITNPDVTRLNNVFFNVRSDGTYDDDIRLDDMLITGEEIPGPAFCGDQGTVYLDADLNGDCYVNWGDFSEFAAQWLQCTDPADPNNCQVSPSAWLDDTFETVAGTTDGTGDFDPDVPAHPFELAINESNEIDVQVWNNPAGTHGGAGNNQYLNIRDGGSWYEVWLSGGSADDLGVSFWLYNSGQTGLQLQIGKRISASLNIGGLNLYWIGNEMLYYDGVFKTPFGSFTTGQWNYIEIWIDWASKTWDLDVDGEPVAVGLYMSNPGIDLLNNVFFNVREDGTNDDDIRLDDVRIWGPGPSACGEPGTEYLDADLNGDCYVNWGDFSEFAGQWLQCTDPANSECDQYWKG